MIGNPILTEGDNCNKLIFIISGKVSITMKDSDDVDREINILQKGDFIG